MRLIRDAITKSDNTATFWAERDGRDSCQPPSRGFALRQHCRAETFVSCIHIARIAQQRRRMSYSETQSFAQFKHKQVGGLWYLLSTTLDALYAYSAYPFTHTYYILPQCEFSINLLAFAILTTTIHSMILFKILTFTWEHIRIACCDFGLKCKVSCFYFPSEFS